MALDFAATYKVLVLGDSNVGKTCIVHRYCDERYYDTYISTIGKMDEQMESYHHRFVFLTKFVYLNCTLLCCSRIGIDFKQKLINLDGVPIKLQIWYMLLNNSITHMSLISPQVNDFEVFMVSSLRAFSMT